MTAAAEDTGSHPATDNVIYLPRVRAPKQDTSSSPPRQPSPPMRDLPVHWAVVLIPIIAFSMAAAILSSDLTRSCPCASGSRSIGIGGRNHSVRAGLGPSARGGLFLVGTRVRRRRAGERLCQRCRQNCFCRQSQSPPIPCCVDAQRCYGILNFEG
jgi:hypothetical protein